MSLRLTEQDQPAAGRNMLYVEKEVDGDGVFVVLCGADEDPSQDGTTIVLNREQLASLKSYIDKLLTE